MAAKKASSSNSRVSTSANKKSGFKFRWWMAVLLVVVVAAVGIAYLRYSHAGGPAATLEANEGSRLRMKLWGNGTITYLYPYRGHLGYWQYGYHGESTCNVLTNLSKGQAVGNGSAVTIDQVPCP